MPETNHVSLIRFAKRRKKTQRIQSSKESRHGFAHINLTSSTSTFNKVGKCLRAITPTIK